MTYKIPNLQDVEREIKEFLVKKDRFYFRNIYPILSYSSKEGYYTVKIVAQDKKIGVNLKDYFDRTFKSGFGKEELETLLEKNHVKLII
ncbi:MAG: hypothetical protein BWY36_00311 [Candidatus Diapherotrites archaeon ADurb.Bin253]|jgi:hypothetical protein|nr:MAG: hypothetical protein BWY36_00311 [Candidatus Diapherotrites archaeon ADurb.Bin253]HNZ52020.1 hypothetical protein [Candidatus Pacearchaeota archaeon]HOC96784.1 hypothetical protein [Candidatus Pacearchaeota archaeon]HOF44111.1 hypothetical protein [Candidatus Pacearchaeota archaeon]HOH04102.1 hypothetical protein [Candidatus Pacearchaeota archaeon]